MYHENEHFSIGKTAQILGVSVPTIRRWEKCGKLIAKFRTFGNHRRFNISDIYKILNKNDDPELLMEAAEWWIKHHKFDHFEKALKIKKIVEEH